MILVIDNYDSFVYNLVQAIVPLGYPCEVRRNDEIEVGEVADLRPTHIVISPGPCTPNEAGVSCQIVERFAGKVPILGVCLGHQCIGQVLGGRIVRAEPMHGKTSPVFHDGRGVFSELPNPLEVARYHSLVVESSSLPDCLERSAWTEDGLVMGVRHRELPGLVGVQFHPESYLSPDGPSLLRRFLQPEGVATP